MGDRLFPRAASSLKEWGCVRSGGCGALSFLLPSGEAGWQHQLPGMERWREGRGLPKANLKWLFGVEMQRGCSSLGIGDSGVPRATDPSVCCPVPRLRSRSGPW